MRKPQAIITASLLSLAVSSVGTLQAFTPTLETLLSREVMHPYQDYGQAVAVEGVLVAVGAPGELADAADAASDTVGAVYVYRRDPTGWLPVQRIAGPSDGNGSRFGATVSLSGNSLVVGAGGYDAGVGAVWCYTWDGAQFTQTAVLRPDYPGEWQWFGDPVVVRGDWLVVGSIGDPDIEPSSGAVYVYQKQGSSWEARGKLKAAEPRPNGNFGWSADVENGRVVVGAQYDMALDATGGTPLGEGGVAYVFQRDPSGQWPTEGAVHALVPVAGAMFGSSVSLSGGDLAVGVPYSSAGARDGGAVEVFRLDAGVWQHVRTLLADDAQVNQIFGSTVRMRGDSLIVGAPGDSTLGAEHLDLAGSFYVYLRGDGGWDFLAERGCAGRLSEDGLGLSLAFDGRSLVAGVPLRWPDLSRQGIESPLAHSGMAYVFEANQIPVARITAASFRVESVNGVDAPVALSSSESVDPDGDVLTAKWSEGPAVLGSDRDLAMSLPIGTHTVDLEVSDGRGTARASAVVEVVRANRAPIARVVQAVVEVTAPTTEGARVVVDGSPSADPDGDSLRFSWSEGEVVLATTPVADVLLGVGRHVLVLQVHDGALSSQVQVTVTVLPPIPPIVSNHPPTADGSLTPQRVIAVDGCKATVLLDASRSSDPDGDALSFRWSEGSKQLAASRQAQVKLGVGTHTLTLRVSDASLTSTASVPVRVLTPVQAVRSLLADVRSAQLPWGKKLAAEAILVGALRSAERGQLRVVTQQLEVFQIVLSIGHTNKAVVRPLMDEAQWIRCALKRA